MTVRITINNHGPLLVKGEFELCDPQGGKFDLGGRNVAALCRCGASNKKPFCDGSHARCGFQSEVVSEPPK